MFNWVEKLCCTCTLPLSTHLTHSTSLHHTSTEWVQYCDIILTPQADVWLTPTHDHYLAPQQTMLCWLSTHRTPYPREHIIKTVYVRTTECTSSILAHKRLTLVILSLGEHTKECLSFIQPNSLNVGSTIHTERLLILFTYAMMSVVSARSPTHWVPSTLTMELGEAHSSVTLWHCTVHLHRSTFNVQYRQALHAYWLVCVVRYRDQLTNELWDTTATMKQLLVATYQQAPQLNDLSCTCGAEVIRLSTLLGRHCLPISKGEQRNALCV